MKRMLALLLALALLFCGAAQAEITDKDTVKAVQQALNDAGFNCGTPDGVAGKNTKRAVALYQGNHGLDPTGEIDEALLAALGLTEGTAEPPSEDTPAADAPPREREAIPDYPANNPDDFIIEGTTLVRYVGTDAHVVIPEGITDFYGAVFSMTEDYEYFTNETLVSVTLPDSLVNLGSGFMDCENLEHVYNIPEGITTLPYQTFLNCHHLKSVDLPDSITEIDGNAFYGCTSLTELRLPANLERIGDAAFYYCENLEELTIPGGVVRIGQSAFDGCKKLTHLEIPDAVTRLRTHTFMDCAALTSIKLPANLETLDVGVFLGCTSLKEVDFPDGVTTMDDAAFSMCDSLQRVHLPSALEALPNSTFFLCSALEQVDMPPAITSIGSSAFYGCEKLVRVDIPDTVTSIGDSAFQQCEALAEVTLPFGLTTLGSQAFAECSSLTAITLPDSVLRIPSGAFAFCEKLARLGIPDTVYSIAGDALEYTSPDLVIVGKSGSAAETFAKENHIAFEAIFSGMTRYTEYGGEAVRAALDAISDALPEAPTSAKEDLPFCGFSPRQPGRLLASFSARQPNMSAEAVDALLYDLTTSADAFVFDMYDFQRDRLKDYTDAEPIDLNLLTQRMPDWWRTPEGLDFCAGTAAGEDCVWYWTFIYYGDEGQNLQNDELNLYLCAVSEGADTGLMDELGLFDPMLGDYHIRQMLISDDALTAALLSAMAQEQDLAASDVDIRQLQPLSTGSLGNDVKDLQRCLTDLGYLDSSVDGVYGPLTREAVAAFQQAQGLEPTGIADPDTQARLLGEPFKRALLTDWLSRHS